MKLLLILFMNDFFKWIENSFLIFLKEKVQLEEQLQELTRSLEESKNYISQLQIQTKKEKYDDSYNPFDALFGKR